MTSELSEEDEPTCAECQESVSVAPEREWDPGMVCNDCAPEVIRRLRGALTEIRDHKTEQFCVWHVQYFKMVAIARNALRIEHQTHEGD